MGCRVTVIPPQLQDDQLERLRGKTGFTEMTEMADMTATADVEVGFSARKLSQPRSAIEMFTAVSFKTRNELMNLLQEWAACMLVIC